jgi:hypothetical protein
MKSKSQKVRQSLGFSLPALLLILTFLPPLLALSSPARAEQVSLAWDPNSETDLGGYKLYYGTASQAYSNVINAGKNNQVTVNNLSPGVTYFFAVTAFTMQGAESDYSNEIHKTILRQYRLTINKRGSGDGNITGEGINCGADCDLWVDEGTPVTLTVDPEPGSVFAGWSGDDCNGVGECTITLNTDKTLTAGLVRDGIVVTKKDINVQGRNVLAGSGPQGDLIRRAGAMAGAIQNEFTAGSLPGNDSFYVITKRNDLRKKNTPFNSGYKQEAVLRFRNGGN